MASRLDASLRRAPWIMAAHARPRYKSLAHPDEVRSLPKTHAEIVGLGDAKHPCWHEGEASRFDRRA
jgi:hypothetical protein